MEAELKTLSTEFAEYVLPWLAVLISIMVAMMVKDLATALTKGMAFRYSRQFSEGERVILDGEDAIITKIGIRQTIFGVYSEKGYVWRFVPNERIQFLKIEKVIDPYLHRDTLAERGERLQKAIDAAQDENIDHNKKEIDKLKRGSK